MANERHDLSHFSRKFKALENIAAGDFVYVEPSGLLDNFEVYAGNNSDFQATWVDSDGANKMVFAGANTLNDSCAQQLGVQGAAGLNNNDYADFTISSTDYTGYTVHMVVVPSATSGDFEFLLSSGANAATNNVKKALTFSQTTNYEQISFTVAGMTADNGSFNPAATLHAGFRCVDDTGSPYVQVARIWMTKSGTTFDGIRKSRGDAYATATQSTFGGTVIGVAPSAITSGNIGDVVLLAPTVSAFSDLVPGWTYGLSTTDGLITYSVSLGSIHLNSYNVGAPMMAGIAISDTDLMLYRGRNT